VNLLHNLRNKKLSIYHPFKGFKKQLIEELGKPTEQFGDLLIYKHKAKTAIWAQNIWKDAEIIPIDSIGDAARKLRALGKIWVPYLHENVRRMTLVQEKLIKIPSKRLNFLEEIPQTPLGHWALLDRDHILASTNCSSPRPHGDWEFNEDKLTPPSRAYLKLWDLFTRMQFHPSKKETCLELGASPGGWTWVLAKFAKQVITYDRAPLADNIAKQKNVTHHIRDAFSVTPETHPDIDWVFSDLICTPEKLYNWVQPWLEDKKQRKFCLTIKLKGEGNREWIDKFKSIPGAQVIHLYHNKHELTFFKV
jgi:23S rRNA (cytidine2498-2'-O)-methyltransferase